MSDSNICILVSDRIVAVGELSRREENLAMKLRLAVLILAVSMAVGTVAIPAMASYSAVNPDGTMSEAWKRRGPTSIYTKEDFERLNAPQTFKYWRPEGWVLYKPLPQ